MTAQTAYFATSDSRHPGVNNSILQESPIVADVYDAMADDDTTVITLPADGDPEQPPRAVNVLRHTGGDITSAAAATRAMSNGDTAEFIIDENGNYSSSQMNEVRRFVTHAFTGLTAANATPAEIAASINGDANLSPYVKAVASLTANAVTLFPIKPRSRVTVGAQPSPLGFAGTADYGARTYVSQACPILLTGTGWSWSYVVSTRVLTVKNETGGAVNRVQIQIIR